MIVEFPARQWKRCTLFDLVSKIDLTVSRARKCGIGGRRSVRSVSNIECVNDLICSQEGQTGTSKSPRHRCRRRGGVIPEIRTHTLTGFPLTWKTWKTPGIL